MIGTPLHRDTLPIAENLQALLKRITTLEFDLDPHFQGYTLDPPWEEHKEKYFIRAITINPQGAKKSELGEHILGQDTIDLFIEVYFPYTERTKQESIRKIIYVAEEHKIYTSPQLIIAQKKILTRVEAFIANAPQPHLLKF